MENETDYITTGNCSKHGLTTFLNGMECRKCLKEMGETPRPDNSSGSNSTGWLSVGWLIEAEEFQRPVFFYDAEKAQKAYECYVAGDFTNTKITELFQPNT